MKKSDWGEIRLMGDGNLQQHDVSVPVEVREYASSFDAAFT